MWVPPGPGIKPMSLALAGGVFTTEPPGIPERDILVSAGDIGFAE